MTDGFILPSFAHNAWCELYRELDPAISLDGFPLWTLRLVDLPGDFSYAGFRILIAA
jgi:hypothetical protein